MRIAVLISGQPRFLHEGATWFKNKLFLKEYSFDVDYYCHFWDNGDPNLEHLVKETFNPVKYKIDNYDDIINKFIIDVKHRNSELPESEWNYVSNDRQFFIFNTNEVATYNRNFWGQYISCQYITDLTGDLTGQYDIIIKTRSDAIITPMSEGLWRKTFENLVRNPHFDDKMFATYMYAQSGVPMIGDFCFISKPTPWYNFSKNARENCFKLATEDKVLWKELDYNNMPGEPHWVWAKISKYSSTNWLSFAVVWPIPFAVTLVRRHEDNIMQYSFNDMITLYKTLPTPWR